MYKLTKKEIKELNNYWEFIYIFKNPDLQLSHNWFNYKINGKTQLFGASEYREYIILKIREKYTIQQFYFYEKMMNKFLHNLIKHINFNICDIIINRKQQLFEISKSFERSYSHKIYITDKKKNISYIFNLYIDINNIDIIQKIFYIMSDRKLYEKVMINKSYFSKIKNIKTYYYPYDYPFPNINLIFYNENKKEFWIDRIQKLYYNYNNGNIDSEWYKFSCDKS
jgi:hypothetical protein